MTSMRTSLSIVLCGLASTPALAADLDLKLQIPQIDVVEYHRPYVAVWLERADQSVAANLAVWYDLKKRDHESEKYLTDLRQWWRRSGRELAMPVDGISGPPRGVGAQEVRLKSGTAPTGDSHAGQSQMVIEATTQTGGPRRGERGRR